MVIARDVSDYMKLLFGNPSWEFGLTATTDGKTVHGGNALTEQNNTISTLSYVDKILNTIIIAIDPEYKMLDEPLKFAIEDFFEQLQAYMVVSGGRKIPIDELKNMALGEITEHVYPIGLRFRVDSIHCVRNLKWKRGYVLQQIWGRKSYIKRCLIIKRPCLLN